LRSLGVDATDGGVQARTFHAAALRQLGHFWPRAIGGPVPQLLEHKIRLVAEAASKVGQRLEGNDLRDVTSEIEWARGTLRTPETYVAAVASERRDPPIAPQDVSLVMRAYQDLKSSRGAIDFDDVLLLTAAIIEEHEDIAAEVHARYRHFVVDEYQDVTPLQQRMLDAWLGQRDSLCVVGDANQTIYSYSGATPSYLLEFTRRFPSAQIVRLVRNYRSSPQIVELANTLISAAKDAPAGARLELVSQQREGLVPAIRGHDDDLTETRGVVGSIRGLLSEGVPASQIAILYRINAQSETYEQSLAAAGIPYVVRGGERFFERRDVREAVMLLRGAAKGAAPEDGTSLPDHVAEVLGTRGWKPEAPAHASSSVRETWENLSALHRLAIETAQADPTAAMPELVALLEERASSQHAPTVEGVTLSTLHAAKGLEWDCVFLVEVV
jgi:DNA helicase-2/ATP-dependent DNA helicase PcrA